MSYHIEGDGRFKNLPERILVREDGYMTDYRFYGEPIVDYWYVPEAENEKLREYAAYLLDFIEPAAHQSGCNKSCPAYKTCVGSTRCTFVSWAIQKARELGVEGS